MARVKEVEETEDPFFKQAKEYAFVKKQIEYLEKQQKELKDQIFTYLESNGEKDSNGNIFTELPEPVDGFVNVIKQRRVSRKINESAAEKIITQKGLEDKLYKTIRIVDEDALMAALYSDELTEAEIDDMYPEKIVWALILGKK